MAKFIGGVARTGANELAIIKRCLWIHDDDACCSRNSALSGNVGSLMRYGKVGFIGAGIAGAGLAAFGAARLASRHPVGNPHVPEPAKPVALERYLGHWYEIARYDQRFERGCGAASAQYDLRSDGNISVLNRCLKRSGRISEVRGVAKVVDPVTNAKLKVSFFRPFYGNYWVLDHGEDYDWSVVGEPSGRYLWILSREKRLNDEQLSALIRRVSEMGYDTSMLIFDNQRFREPY